MRAEKLLNALQRFYSQSPPGDYCVLGVLDFDHFKSLNDTYGHLYGDAVLLRFWKFARRQKQLRILRYGGDEFCIFFRENTLQKAKLFSENFHFKTRCFLQKIAQADAAFLTDVCLGILIWHNTDQLPFLDAFRLADDFLYEAKKKGPGHLVMKQLDQIMKMPKD